MTMMEREEKEDKINKIKGFPLSKQVGVVLKINSFLEGKKKNPKLLGGEVRWFFFKRTISFGVGRTKV